MSNPQLRNASIGISLAAVAGILTVLVSMTRPEEVRQWDATVAALLTFLLSPYLVIILLVYHSRSRKKLMLLFGVALVICANGLAAWGSEAHDYYATPVEERRYRQGMVLVFLATLVQYTLIVPLAVLLWCPFMRDADETR